MPALRTENLAIVFTDIVGYTARTSRQTREENARLLAEHDRLLLPIVRAFGGRRIKSIGDALLLAFRSPTDSVLCGMAMQDRLARHAVESRETERLVIRVAINLGEVRLERGDVFGEPVNVAARLEHETPPGEVWLTDAVQLSMNRAEVELDEVGTRELRGVSQPVRIHRVRRIDGPLPFGGVALARAEGSAPRVDRWLGVGAVLVPALRSAAAARQLLGRLRSAVGEPSDGARARRRRGGPGHPGCRGRGACGRGPSDGRSAPSPVGLRGGARHPRAAGTNSGSPRAPWPGARPGPPPGRGAVLLEEAAKIDSAARWRPGPSSPCWSTASRLAGPGGGRSPGKARRPGSACAGQADAVGRVPQALGGGRWVAAHPIEDAVDLRDVYLSDIRVRDCNIVVRARQVADVGDERAVEPLREMPSARGCWAHRRLRGSGRPVRAETAGEALSFALCVR